MDFEPPVPPPSGYVPREERMVVAVERIANAFERIAAALEQPAPRPAEQPVGCQHPMKARVNFGPGADAGLGDEWECAVVRGGCGYRTPALVANGG